MCSVYPVVLEIFENEEKKFGYWFKQSLLQNYFAAVELSLGNLYCFKCCDYIYDEDCDRISQSLLRKASNSLGKLQNELMSCMGIRARGFVLTGIRHYVSPWEPSEIELELLLQHPKRRKVDGNSTIGSSSKIMFNNTRIQYFHGD